MIASHGLLMFIVCLESLEYIGQRPVACAIKVTSDQPDCYQPNQFLIDYHNCKPSEFQTEVICEGGDLSIECPKSKRVVLYSATNIVSSGACTPLSNNNRGACRHSCIHQAALVQCHGRQTCNKPVASNVFGTGCTSGHLALTYTCVSQQVLKKEKYVNDGGPCITTPRPETTSKPSTVRPNRQGVATVQGDKHDINLRPAAEQTQSPDVLEVVEHKTTATLYTGTSVNEVTSVSTLAEKGIGIVADWTWTTLFLKANREKLIVYLLLSVCVGTICLLVVVVFRLLQVQQRRSKSMSLPDSVGTTSRVQTSTQTPPGETAPLLSAQDGIELLRFSHTGPREDTPDSGTPRSPKKSVPVETTYYPATASQASTMMTPDRSDQYSPQYQGFQSLGRSYNNPYRHDTYRTDGFRTISK